jgi:hypothetical protein
MTDEEKGRLAWYAVGLGIGFFNGWVWFALI